MRLNLNLLQALHGQPEEQWVIILSRGIGAGRWNEADWDAFEALTPAERRKAVRDHLEVLPTPKPEAPRERRTYRKRADRLRDRTIRPGTHYARRHSLDPFYDARISSGAARTLTHLIARCGRSRTYRALTSCLAQDLACHQRTVQRHFNELQAAGYLICAAPDRRHRTTVYLTPAVEPPPVRKKDRENPPTSAAESATKMSPTQPIKGEGKGDTGGASSGTEAVVVAGAPDPGAELPRPAQPLDQALVAGEKAPEPSKDHEKRLQPGKPGQEASGEPDAEPTTLDQALDAILRRVEAFAAEKRAETPETGNGRPGSAEANLSAKQHGVPLSEKVRSDRPPH